MVIDESGYQEKVEVYFETKGKLNEEEIRNILNEIRIVVEQRTKTISGSVTIIRL